MPRCLIVDPMHESLFPLLENLGWNVDYFPALTPDEIRAKHVGYDGLIIRTKTYVGRELLGENPTLKFVGRAGAGIDNLDIDYLKEKNIEVIHAAEGNRDAVGEHTVGILLTLLRHIATADQEIRKGQWHREANRGVELGGKTVGIIGYGNMGSSFARRLSGFGCKVLAYDKYKRNFSDTFCEESQMDKLFEEVDILSLHIPLTEETRGMVNARYIQQFKKQIILINTARGEIAPFVDLENAMKENRITGAALDVLENEKLSTFTTQQRLAFNYLCEKTNVIFTPHIAGWTVESHVKINVVLVDKIKALKLSV